MTQDAGIQKMINNLYTFYSIPGMTPGGKLPPPSGVPVRSGILFYMDFEYGLFNACPECKKLQMKKCHNTGFYECQWCGEEWRRRGSRAEFERIP